MSPVQAPPGAGARPRTAPARPVPSSGGARRPTRPPSRRRTNPSRRRRTNPEVVGRRIRFFRLVLVVAVGVVVLRLIWVQGFDSSRYQRAGIAELTRTVPLPALRGGIYDRNGQVLALSVPTDNVVADDFQILHPVPEAAALSPLVGVPAATLAVELHQHSGYVIVARNLSEATGQRISKGNYPGITLLAHSVREVPNGALAAPIIGSLNAAGQPVSGIELDQQRLLRGHPGSESVLVSPTGVDLPQAGSSERMTPAAPGTGVELTLDEPLQLETEQALGAEITQAHARWGVAEIMDTRTGQILASANLVANPGGTGVTEAPTDYAVTQAYEPGSVFKLVTFSAALQDKIITPDTLLTVPGRIQLDGTTFADDSFHPTEPMSASEILAQSSDIGTSEIAQKLGEQRLLAQVLHLGFGQKTALDFPGEASGILKTAATWEPTDYVDLAIGQDDAVTPQQILDAENAVANGGVLVQPKLVRATVNQSGAARATPPSTRRRVMPASVATELLHMMERVTIDGTGTAADIPGYTVAGKTGTANIPNLAHAFDATFVGSVPVNHPVLSAIVMLNQPNPPYGGSVAAPVFSQIMQYALHRYSIPTSPGASVAPSGAAAGNPKGSFP